MKLLLRRRSAALLLILFLTACAHQIRPNAVSKLDDETYTFLTATQASLKQTSEELKAGSLPPGVLPYFNTAVEGYSKTRGVWLSYRAAKATNKELSDAMALFATAIMELNKKAGRLP